MFTKIKLYCVSMAIMMVMMVGVGVVQAQKTILPEAGGADCEALLTGFAKDSSKAASDMDQILGCAIKTGRVSLSMVPHFIRYFSNYLLGLVSLLSLLFTVIGGFMYISSGMVSEYKDKGKKYITNALIGMAIAFLAWSVVNVIMAALTG